MKSINIRLYNVTDYNKNVSYRPLRYLLNKGTKLANINNSNYSHASISVWGDFYTMNNKGVDLENTPIDLDPDTTLVSEYKIDVSDREWDKANKLLKYAIVHSKELKYNYPLLLGIGASMIKKRLSGKYTHLNYFSESEFRNSYVCSTFCAWILYKSVDKVKRYIDENNFKLKHIAPVELLYFPGMTRVYTKKLNEINGE